jgi:hypothetical protein
MLRPELLKTDITILHVANTTATRTIRPDNGVGFGLCSDDLLLEFRQQLLRFGKV